MKISIVTPSLNQGRFIEETIKSVISQEGDFELEYIIIDGSSSDETIKIIKKYEKLIKTKKIKPKCKKLTFKWLSENDSGQSQAINKGFRIASGEIINWICSDDLLEKNSLREISNFFKKNETAKIVFGNSNKIDQSGRTLKTFYGRNFTRKELITRWEGYFGNYEIIQPSLFFKKELLNEFGYLNEKTHFAMDYEWWLKANKKYRFYYIDKILSSARFYPETKSVKNEKETMQAIMKFSKRYWNEDPIRYRLSYYLFLLKRPFFQLSAVLKERSKTYTELLLKFKKLFNVK